MSNYRSKSTVAVLVSALALACSPPPEGSNYWKQVNREYESRDYMDMLNYLDDVLRTENDFTHRAAAWKVTILGGMARAALEVEEACAAGIFRVAQWDSEPYRKCIEQFRWQTRTRTQSLIDAVDQFETVASTADVAVLDFPLPPAGATPHPIPGRIKTGDFPHEKVLEPALARITERQLVLQAQDMTGTPDVPETVAKFESHPVTVSKALFLVGVAKTLVTTSKVFEKDKLDDETKRTAVLDQAHDCLDVALQGDDEDAKKAAQALSREIRQQLS